MKSLQCYGCIRRYPGSRQCQAFPDGIPDDIYLGKVIHDKPYEGDHGLMYISIDDYDETEEVEYVEPIDS